MPENIFLSYGSMTAVYLEHNFQKVRKAWDPQQPVETLFKQIQDCVDCAEAGGIAISEAQWLTTVLRCGAKQWREIPASGAPSYKLIKGGGGVDDIETT
jgi:hypothetical protein